MRFLGLNIIFRRIKHLKDLLRDPNVGKGKKLLVIFGFIYLLLPLDLIPPVLFPIGFLDDLVLWIFILWHLKDILDSYAEAADLGKKYPKDKVIESEYTEEQHD